jgi:hypothetical protein
MQQESGPSVIYLRILKTTSTVGHGCDGGGRLVGLRCDP